MDESSKKALKNQIVSELLALDNEDYQATSAYLKSLVSSLTTKAKEIESFDDLKELYNFTANTKKKIIKSAIDERISLWEKANQILNED